MSTSDIKKSRILYLSATGFILLFGMIYEAFSHNVYSPYMIWGFLVPLAGFGINEAFIRMAKNGRRSGNLHFQLLGGATVWMTLGSVFKGVLDIYGTTNHKIIIFVIAGAIQLAAAGIFCFMNSSKK